MGSFSISLSPVQRIQNSAGLVLKKKKTDHSSPLLPYLHWLLVSQRIQYKTDTETASSTSASMGFALSYLCDTQTQSTFTHHHAPSALLLSISPSCQILSVSESHDPKFRLLALIRSLSLVLLPGTNSPCLYVKHPPRPLSIQIIP